MNRIRFDRGRHHRAKIGYVLLATEQTIQDDVMQLRPDGVGIHFSRVPIADSITVDSLEQQAAHLAPAAAQLLPDGSLDVICYACTSGSLVLGEELVKTELKRGAPNAIATSLISAVIHALKTLGVTRIAVATPYLDEINQREKQYLEQAGFDVVNIEGLQLEHDSDMVRVTPDYLMEFAASVDRAAAEALFISCGALRSLDIIDDLERLVAKPAVCSNQAMIWQCLRLAGIEQRFQDYGSLLRDY